ncbi:hypothetical protein HDU76_012843 [Blyttiomyces sp. JEL0837]|nr:hypothetical protein HDU76_012843 [Blyttiomyces sp. JEL0837]
MNVSSDSMLEDSMPSTSMEPPITASLGISIEPMENCLAALEMKNVVGQHMNGGGGDMAMVPLGLGKVVSTDPPQVAGKLLESLYNYCASFATSLPPNAQALFGLDWSTTYIPLKALQDWFNNTQRKLKADPSASFLK